LQQYAIEAAAAQFSGGSVLASGVAELAVHGTAGRRGKKAVAAAKNSAAAAAAAAATATGAAPPKRGHRDQLIEVQCSAEDSDRFLTNEMITRLIVHRYCPPGAPFGAYPESGIISLAFVASFKWSPPNHLRYNPKTIDDAVDEWSRDGFAGIDRTPVPTARIGSWLSARCAADDAVLELEDSEDEESFGALQERAVDEANKDATREALGFLKEATTVAYAMLGGGAKDRAGAADLLETVRPAASLARAAQRKRASGSSSAGTQGGSESKRPKANPAQGKTPQGQKGRFKPQVPALAFSSDVGVHGAGK
jgi:hypothetical protein